MAPKQENYTLARYRAEAKKEPFVLKVDERTSITIPPPNGNTLLDLDGAFTTRAVLQLLAGDQYDALIEAIGEEDGSVLMALTKDMQKHFGLGG